MNINLLDENIKKVFENELKNNTGETMNYFHQNVYFSSDKKVIENFFDSNYFSEIEVQSVLNYYISFISNNKIKEEDAIKIITISSNYFLIDDPYYTNNSFRKLKLELFKKLDLIKHFALFNFELSDTLQMEVLRVNENLYSIKLLLNKYSQLFEKITSFYLISLIDIANTLKNLKNDSYIEKFLTNKEQLELFYGIHKGLSLIYTDNIANSYTYSLNLTDNLLKIKYRINELITLIGNESNDFVYDLKDLINHIDILTSYNKVIKDYKIIKENLTYNLTSYIKNKSNDLKDLYDEIISNIDNLNLNLFEQLISNDKSNFILELYDLEKDFINVYNNNLFSFKSLEQLYLKIINVLKKFLLLNYYKNKTSFIYYDGFNIKREINENQLINNDIDNIIYLMGLNKVNNELYVSLVYDLNEIIHFPESSIYLDIKEKVIKQNIEYLYSLFYEVLNKLMLYIKESNEGFYYDDLTFDIGLFIIENKDIDLNKIMDHFNTGFNRVLNTLKVLEYEEIISKADSDYNREILITKQEFKNKWKKRGK